MRKCLFPIVVAALAALFSVHAFGESTSTGPLRQGVRVARMGRQPQKTASSNACRVSFGGCLSTCSKSDSGCVMECETDCSVCVLEDSGQLNSPFCERK